MNEEDYHETDEMEMPCMCNCGAWFDLNEGFHDLKRSGNVVCQDCHERQLRVMSIRMRLAELELREEKKTLAIRQQIYRLKQQLTEMGEDID